MSDIGRRGGLEGLVVDLGEVPAADFGQGSCEAMS